MENQLPKNIQKLVGYPARLSKIRELSLKNSLDDPQLSVITKMLAEQLDVEIAAINFVDEKFQTVFCVQGDLPEKVKVEDCFCAHSLACENEIFIVPDASLDKRFYKNPLVTCEGGIKFYAGFPLVFDGQTVGALCAISRTPREGLSKKQKARFTELGQLVNSYIALKSDAADKTIFAEQRDTEMRRHQLSIKASQVVTWIWNVDDNSIECDSEMREMFAIKHEDQLFADELAKAIHPEDMKGVQFNIDKALQEKSDYVSEYRIAPTGRWVFSQGAILERDVDGKPKKVAGVNLDITERKLSEEKTRLLLRELNHRVKNTLAMLQAIASQTLRSAETPEAFQEAFSNRISGIATAHTLLSDKEWEPIDIHSLIKDQTKLYVFSDSNQIDIAGDNITTGPENALALGMVIHELATNAAKYGALSTDNGRVDVRTRLVQSPEKTGLNITWVEKGGPQVKKPQKTGFGTTMITRSLDRMIDSSVELQFLPDGVQAQIFIPV